MLCINAHITSDKTKYYYPLGKLGWWNCIFLGWTLMSFQCSWQGIHSCTRGHLKSVPGVGTGFFCKGWILYSCSQIIWAQCAGVILMTEYQNTENPYCLLLNISTCVQLFFFAYHQVWSIKLVSCRVWHFSSPFITSLDKLIHQKPDSIITLNTDWFFVNLFFVN